MLLKKKKKKSITFLSRCFKGKTWAFEHSVLLLVFVFFFCPLSEFSKTHSRKMCEMCGQSLSPKPFSLLTLCKSWEGGFTKKDILPFPLSFFFLNGRNNLYSSSSSGTKLKLKVYWRAASQVQCWAQLGFLVLALTNLHNHPLLP